jgi:predicted transcriptional regulator
VTYKIVRNAANEIVAYGLNDGNYEPTIKAGEVLSIESSAVAEPLIAAINSKAKLIAETAELDRLKLVESGDAKLRTAGLSQAEIDARRVEK